MGATWAAKVNVKVPSSPLLCKSLTKSCFPPAPETPTIRGSGKKFIIFRLKELTRVGANYAGRKVSRLLGAGPATANPQGKEGGKLANLVLNLRGGRDDSWGWGMGSSRKKERRGRRGPRGAAAYPWGSEGGGKRKEAPPRSAEEKALGSVSSCPTPTTGRGRVLVPSFLSRAQKLFLVEPLEEAFTELISADHDGTRRGGLDDPREEACGGRGRLRSEVGPPGAPPPPGSGHTQPLTCKEAPGARLGPDSPQQ